MSYCKITKQWLSANEMQLVYTEFGNRILCSEEVETHECMDCGNTFVIIEEDYRYKDCSGNCLCRECVDDYKICDDCGDWSNETFYVDGRDICEGCLDDYCWCDECERYIHPDNSVSVADKTICEDCRDRYYTKCECCGGYFKTTYQTEDEYNLCGSCYDDSTSRCAGCGYVYYGVYSLEEIEGDWYCEDCANMHRDIHSYSYKPYLEFNNVDEDTDEYFGFEIEVEGDKSNALNFKKEYGDIEEDEIYLKKDCSVDGFEIVTHPMTRKWFYQEFVPKITNGMSFLKQNGFSAHDKAGMHIHVSKEAISCEQLQKLIILLYPKTEKVKNVWIAISQRKKYNIERWASIDENVLKDGNKKYTIKEKYKDKDINSERYSAINTLPHHTIEFRIFNSNLRIERIKKNAQVVFSLIDFTKTTQMPKMSNYMNFIKEHRDSYKELYDFIVEKNIWDFSLKGEEQCV